MSASLGAHSVGVILLGVHDLKKPSLYCCTSADITNTLNDLPSADLIIGQGSPLSSLPETAYYTNGELNDLLQESRELRNVKEDDDVNTSASSKLLHCTIYEADSKSTEMHAVFRGYIVSVLEISRAGSLTVKALRVRCMGVAAVLHISPLAGYRRTTGAAIANAIAGLGELPRAKAELSAKLIDPLNSLSNGTDDAIIRKYGKDLAAVDILTRIAYIANVLVYISEARTKEDGYEYLKKPDDKLLHIKDCVYCDYTLHTKNFLYVNNVNNSFNKYIASHLIQTLQGASLLMSIISACTSNEVMLNFVPHFKYGGTADDFRMELKPSEAWDATNLITIPNSYVTACNSTLNHLEHLGDPQVILVNYALGVGNMDGSQKDGVPSKSGYGVYSPIKKISDWAKLRYQLVDKPEANAAMKQGIYRVRFFGAPKWLDWSYVSYKKPPSAAEFKQGALQPGDSNAEGTPTDQNNITAATKQADNIAKALYLHMHGSSDVAVFELTTDLRFGLNADIGCLENHIGSIVDINGYRGMLQSVRYNYTSGKNTTSSYTITLSRVRPINYKEEHVKCPLYEKLKETTSKGSQSNTEAWADDWTYKA